MVKCLEIASVWVIDSTKFRKPWCIDTGDCYPGEADEPHERSGLHAETLLGQVNNLETNIHAGPNTHLYQNVIKSVSRIQIVTPKITVRIRIVIFKIFGSEPDLWFCKSQSGFANHIGICNTAEK